MKKQSKLAASSNVLTLGDSNEQKLYDSDDGTGDEDEEISQKVKLPKIDQFFKYARFFTSSCGFTVENENFSSKKGYTLKQELAYYLTSRQDNPLDISSYWRNNSSKLPLLASLVRKYCIIQATSVASESRFSIANYVGRKERASLSSRNLRFSMILREEPKFEKKFKEINFRLI